MAKVEHTISVNMDAVTDFTKRVEAMVAFFEAAPETDPVKAEMLKFGEIDVAKHFEVGVETVDKKFVATVTVDAELQRIMDMVPV